MKEEYKFKFFQILGIDKNIFWSTLNKVFGIIKGPVSIIFLVKFLTIEEQGIWYTIINLSSLTILAELGFTNIVSQFISHEVAHIKIINENFKGEEERLEKLSSIFRFSLKIYLVIIPFSFIILTILGLLYFSNSTLNIKTIWILYSIIGALTLLLSFFQSIYQSFDRIVPIQKSLFFSAIISTIAYWLSLYLNFSIWTIVISTFFSFSICLLYLYFDSPKFWFNLFKLKSKSKIKVYNEILPLQLKYGITFICSYLITYLLVPSIYKFIGASEAGKFGLALSLIATINSIALNWINTKVPKLSFLVSKNNTSEHKAMFKKALKDGLIVLIALYLILIIGYYVIGEFYKSYQDRFPEFKQFLFLIFVGIIQYIISTIITYLRSFKKEPFVFLQIVNTVIVLNLIYFNIYLSKNIFEFTKNLFLFNILFLLPTYAWLFIKRYKKIS
jgi:O-antigen/teichoic acid export membrane protein